MDHFHQGPSPGGEDFPVIFLFIFSERQKPESDSAAERRDSGRSRAGRPEASPLPPSSGSRPCVHLTCSSGRISHRVSDMTLEGSHLRPWPENVQLFAGRVLATQHPRSAWAPSAKRVPLSEALAA